MREELNQYLDSTTSMASALGGEALGSVVCAANEVGGS